MTPDALQTLLRVVHIVGGLLAFAVTPLVLLAFKGSHKHIVAGRCFVLGKGSAAIAGIVLTVVLLQLNVGLLLLGFTALFFTAIGYLAPRIGRGSPWSYRVDRALTVLVRSARKSRFGRRRPAQFEPCGAGHCGRDVRRSRHVGRHSPLAVAWSGGCVPLAGRAFHRSLGRVLGRVGLRHGAIRTGASTGRARDRANPRVCGHPVGTVALSSHSTCGDMIALF